MNQQNKNNMSDEEYPDSPENRNEAPYQEHDPLAPTEPGQEGEAAEEHAGHDVRAILEAQVEALSTELDKTKDQMLRAVAEAENTRKRLLREREDVRKYAVSDFAKDLLDFSDNFRRALESVPPELKEADERIANVLTGVEAMEKNC